MIRSLPNLISLARLAAVPVILHDLYRGRYDAALVWCLAAGLSDALDGYLARRLHAESRLGAYLDPIGDKFLLSGIFLVLALTGVVPWWLTALVFARDLLILLFAGMAMLLTKLRDFAPSLWGKLSTAIQIVTVLLIMVAQTEWGAFARFLVRPAVLLTVLVTGWSAVHYGWVAVRMVQREQARVAGPGVH